jgi:hypothetical protein
MSTLIPNENCWIGFSEDFPADADGLVPTAAEVAGAVELTDFIISLTANAQGNAVPTPKLKSMFETSIPGTNTATFTAEMYRDSVQAEDLAWNTLPRNTYGVFYISRFGGTGTDLLPVATDHVEVWPMRVISRAASPMSSNTAQTFTMTGSVPQEPNEDAIVAA